jgi:hypothetical protein
MSEAAKDADDPWVEMSLARTCCIAGLERKPARPLEATTKNFKKNLNQIT